MGYIDIKQQETYKKLKNRGWYSKCYWFVNATTTTTDNDNNHDNISASTVTTTATTNNTINNNNNVTIIKIITTIKMKNGCALQK